MKQHHWKGVVLKSFLSPLLAQIDLCSAEAGTHSQQMPYASRYADHVMKNLVDEQATTRNHFPGLE